MVKIPNPSSFPVKKRNPSRSASGGFFATQFVLVNYISGYLSCVLLCFAILKQVNTERRRISGPDLVLHQARQTVQVSPI
jgi:hypothetical protein